MTMLELLDVAQIHGFDQKLQQFCDDIRKHPEIGRMDAWKFLRSALRQVACPACMDRGASVPGDCNYCLGIGTVDYHLTSHPMNVHSIAKDMSDDRRCLPR